MAGLAMAAVMTLATVAPARAAEAASSAAAASCSYSNNAASAMAGWRMRSSSCRSSGELETSWRELGWSGSSWSGDVLMQCGGKSGAVSRRMRATVEAKQGDELSYVMVKPDGVQRGLVGEIISRFEKKGFKLRGLKLFQTPQDLAEEHYAELKERPFFPKLVQYIVSGPVVAMAWEGPGVVASARKIIGVTNPLLAEPGTIRGDFGIEVGRNVVHGSDSAENGLREVALWFKEGELVEWDPELTPWLRE